MRLKEFQLLSKLEQSRLVGGGKLISSKRSENIISVLYLIDEFHVEAFYSRKNMQLLDLKGITDQTVINSYTTNDINPFTHSNYIDIKGGTYDHRFILNY